MAAHMAVRVSRVSAHMAAQMELPYVSSGIDLVGLPDFWKSRTNIEHA